jgi:hypothetical protein
MRERFTLTFCLALKATAPRPAHRTTTAELSYLIMRIKTRTHRMCARDHLFYTHGYKVFTDSHMSRIKYNLLHK